MKGLRNFLADTWWVFTLALVASVLAGYFTGVWLYYVFPPMLIPVVLYMASVRYDADGNLREDQRMR
ncbi:hypothetical protein MalM25_05210 [Planctomycetes bacterium MalM25]|nr:hypothetical protein MalM25_05210 [Planctomycetes bacterium MalM25]